jgi:hypothetical protein
MQNSPRIILLLEATRVEESVFGHVIVGYVNRIDLSKVNRAALHVGHAEIGPGVFAGAIGWAFLKAVADDRDILRRDGRGLNGVQKLDRRLFSRISSILPERNLPPAFLIVVRE